MSSSVPAWEGRRRANALAYVRRVGEVRRLPCVICRLPIDYRKAYPDPRSCSVQHVKPRSLYPHLTWVRSNWAPAHLDCNKVEGVGSGEGLGVVSPW